MRLIHSITELQNLLIEHRNNNDSIAFVPTMGNLHEGHLTLVREAKRVADVTVVSIFVNPMQFGPDEDLNNYPRSMDEDCASLMKLGTHIVFAPTAMEFYPKPMEQTTSVIVPGISNILCGEQRATHFTGVTTVVAKLFHIVQPHIAFFGEKDYQQLHIIKTMVNDLNMAIEIQGIETVREDDGLAMSSRNQYLTEAERKNAAELYKSLQKIKQAVLAENTNFAELEQKAKTELLAFGFEPEYISIRDGATLIEGKPEHEHLRVFAAARLGKARLIDNIRIK